MGKIVVAVDTNVIFSSMIRDEGVSRVFLLLSTIHPDMKLVISDVIYEEINKHKLEIARKAGIPIVLFYRGLNKLLSKVEVVNIRGKFDKEYLMRFVKDRDDAHVVALAFCSGARYIVTYNKKHFIKKALSPKGIKIRTPPEFLSELDYLWVDRFVKKKSRGIIKTKYSWRLSRKHKSKK